MIIVKNIKALSDLSLQYLVLQWEIDDTSEHVQNYVYDIYRCVGADNEDEYIYLNCVKGDKFTYYDTKADQHKKGIHFYYKIVPRHIQTQETGKAVKCLSLFDKKKDKYANYIRRTYDTYLKAIGNSHGYILTKRRFGQKCSRCWDDIRRQHRQHNCLSCFGTGYEGGYNTAYKTRFNYISSTIGTNESINVDGRGDSNQDISIWIEAYPLVSVGDIFVDENNDRYKVSQVQRTTKNNEFILRQVLNMQLLATSDPVYSVIINVEEV